MSDSSSFPSSQSTFEILVDAYYPSISFKQLPNRHFQNISSQEPFNIQHLAMGQAYSKVSIPRVSSVKTHLSLMYLKHGSTVGLMMTPWVATCRHFNWQWNSCVLIELTLGILSFASTLNFKDTQHVITIAKWIVPQHVSTARRWPPPFWDVAAVVLSVTNLYNFVVKYRKRQVCFA